MRDILAAVSARTGAEVQFPVGSLGDNVFVHLGPGTPQEVVTKLLKGSDFNYVILSPSSEPDGIARLILTRAATSHEAPSSSSAVLSNNATAPQLYGAGFSTDADSAAVDPGLNQEPPPVPAASWIHHDGAVLSADQLDQMQKSAIQQEQQQFSQQEQQRQQQQQQASQDTSQQ